MVPVDPRVHGDVVRLLIGQVGGVGVDPLVFGHRIGAWRAQELRLPDSSGSVVVHCGKLGDRRRGYRLARRGQVVVGRVQQDVGLVVQGHLDLDVAVVLGDVPVAAGPERGVAVVHRPPEGVVVDVIAVDPRVDLDLVVLPVSQVGRVGEHPLDPLDGAGRGLGHQVEDEHGTVGVVVHAGQLGDRRGGCVAHVHPGLAPRGLVGADLQLGGDLDAAGVGVQPERQGDLHALGAVDADRERAGRLAVDPGADLEDRGFVAQVPSRQGDVHPALVEVADRQRAAAVVVVRAGLARGGVLALVGGDAQLRGVGGPRGRVRAVGAG